MYVSNCCFHDKLYLCGKFLLQNWKELQANGGRRAGKLHPKWHVNGETDGRPKGRVSSEIPRSTSCYCVCV